MSDLLRDLAKNLPPKDLQNLSLTSHQAKAFSLWADDLPIVNVSQSAKLLYQCVKELCQIDISSTHRWTLISCIRPKVHYICESLKHHYERQPILLTQQSRKVANLCQLLQKHLATAIKRTLVDLDTTSGFLSKQKDLIPHCIHRALSENLLILLRCYKLYHPPASFLWLDLNRLYALAEDLELLDFRLSDPELYNIQHSKITADNITNQKPSELSIAELYKTAILLDTSQPHKIVPGDMDVLFSNCITLARTVIITKTIDDSSFFYFDVTEDKPAFHTSKLITDDSSRHELASLEQLRYVNTETLVNTLKQMQASQKQFSGSISSTSNALVRLLPHLCNTWSTKLERSNKRIKEDSLITTVVGLKACYLQIQNSEQTHQQNTVIDTVSNPTDQPTKLVDETGKLTEHYYQPPAAFPSNSRINKADKAIAIEQFTAQIINSSAHGACLGWPMDIPGPLKNGELIGLQFALQEKWEIGIIRWTRHFGKEGLKTGVELLTNAIEPIKLRNTTMEKGNSIQSLWQKGFLLPPQKLGANPSIITPSTGFKKRDSLLLTLSENEYTVILENLLASYFGFLHFEIDSLGNSLLQTDESSNHSLEKCSKNEEEGRHHSNSCDAPPLTAVEKKSGFDGANSTWPDL